MIRRPFFVGVAFVAAVCVTALAGRAVLLDPEHAKPPHVRPADSGRTFGPLPLSVVGGEHAGAVIGWLDGLARAEWFAGVERAAQEAVAEAERLAAAQQARSQPRVGGGGGTCDADVWDCLAQCESGGDWNIDTGNGFYGGLQIADPAAGDMTREEQIAFAERILERQGWGAWPACSRKLGLR